MEAVTKLDSRRRGIFPPPFQPGDCVIAEYQDGGRITFRLIKPADVPEVRAVQRDGMTLLKAPETSRARIVEAVRADRDSR